MTVIMLDESGGPEFQHTFAIRHVDGTEMTIIDMHEPYVDIRLSQAGTIPVNGIPVPKYVFTGDVRPKGISGFLPIGVL